MNQLNFILFCSLLSAVTAIPTYIHFNNIMLYLCTLVAILYKAIITLKNVELQRMEHIVLLIAVTRGV